MLQELSSLAFFGFPISLHFQFFHLNLLNLFNLLSPEQEGQAKYVYLLETNLVASCCWTKMASPFVTPQLSGQDMEGQNGRPPGFQQGVHYVAFKKE